MNLPDEMERLLRDIPALRRANLVGGCVRDSLLGIVHKDFDLDVTRISVSYQPTPREGKNILVQWSGLAGMKHNAANQTVTFLEHAFECQNAGSV